MLISIGTFEYRTEIVVKSDGPDSRILSDGQLEKEAWNADEEQHQEVGNEEGSTTVFETQVWKSPNIAKTLKEDFSFSFLKSKFLIW